MAKSRGGAPEHARACKSVAGFFRCRSDRRRSGSSKARSFHEGRVGSDLGRTGPRQRATRTSGENGKATGASEAGRTSPAFGEENVPRSARAHRRSVACAVKRGSPRNHGFRPDVFGSRTSRGCPRLERVDGIHRPHASLAEVAPTIERSKVSRQSSPRRAYVCR